MKKIKAILVGVFLVAFLSCEELLFVDDISKDQVEIIVPQNGTQVSSAQIRFTWQSLEGAEAYRFQLASPSFDSIQSLLVNEVVEETFFEQNLTKGDYEWRVNGINSEYVSQSTTNAISVKEDQDFSAREIKIISPDEEHSAFKTFTINFEWEGLTNAGQYRIKIEHNEVIFSEETTTETQLNLTVPYGKSTFKIRGENDTQNTFYALRNFVVDTIAPEKIQLVSPTNNEELDTETVQFDYQKATDDEGAEEFDSIYIFNDKELENLVLKEELVGPENQSLDRENTYYWYMQSFDNAGNIGDQSEVYSFTIE